MAMESEPREGGRVHEPRQLRFEPSTVLLIPAYMVNALAHKASPEAPIWRKSLTGYIMKAL